MISINGTHDISVAETGELTLGRLVWRQVGGNRMPISEVMAIYRSEVLLVRDLISDCIGIAVRREDIKDLTKISVIYEKLLPRCQDAFSVLAPLREQKKAEYEKRMRQGEEPEARADGSAKVAAQ